MAPTSCSWPPARRPAAAEARKALGAGAGLVTDVGSVKAPIVAAVADSRFVGGHPMAGSEQEGVAGARPDLFRNAVWVLTPTDDTDDDSLVKIPLGGGLAGGRRGVAGPRAPRRAGGSGVACAPPHRGHPHGAGRRAI